MANWDNQSTRLEQERLQDEVDAGLVAGCEAAPMLIDVVAFDEGKQAGYATILYPAPAPLYKRVMDLTAREQGFVVGWLVRMDETTRGQG